MSLLIFTKTSKYFNGRNGNITGFVRCLPLQVFFFVFGIIEFIIFFPVKNLEKNRTE